jgi:exodeoxyribonuclease VII large subunit
MDERLVISVLDLNTYVSDRMYQDPFLEEVWVQGEVSGFDIKHDTAYFTLTDGQASVDCIIFEFEQSGLESGLEGRSVILNGDISIYRKNGRFRIVVESLLPAGVGDLFLSFNKLKEELEKKRCFCAGT